jgi:hypothetical protein
MIGKLGSRDRGDELVQMPTGKPETECGGDVKIFEDLKMDLCWQVQKGWAEWCCYLLSATTVEKHPKQRMMSRCHR